MSIIHEALQKAVSAKSHQEPKSGKVFQTATNRPPALKSAPAVEFLGRKNAFNWGPVFVILVLTLITGPVISPLFSTPAKSPAAGAATGLSQVPRDTASDAIKTVSVGDDRQAQFGIEEMPRPALPAAAVIGVPAAPAGVPDFYLNGIVFSPSRAYCLINDKIVRVGDKVGGATVKAIGSDKAVLEYEGRQVVLTTST